MATAKKTAKTANACKQAEDKYSAIFHNSADAIFVADPVSRKIVDCNNAAELLTGYSESETLSMQVEELHPHDRRVEGLAEFKKAAKGIDTLVESEVMTKSGHRIPIEITTSIINVDSGTYLIGVYKNITERIRAEERLLKDKQYIDNLLNGIEDIFYVVNNEGYFVRWNRACEELSGYSPKELSAMKAVELFDEAGAINIANAIQEAFTTGHANATEELLTKNGQKIPMCFSGRIMEDFFGKSVLCGIGKDISSLKIIEDELRASEERFRKLFEDNSAAIIFLDPATTDIIDVNSAAEKFYGWTTAELKQMKIYQINALPPEKVREIVAETWRSRHSRHEFPHRLHDGTIRYVEAYANVVEINGRDFIYSTIHDISERKQAVDDLRASENRYRNFIEIVGQIAWTTLPDGQVADMPDWRKYTGQTPEEIKGWGWLNALHPEDRERTVEIWNKAMADKSLYETEYRVRRYDGEYRYFIARGVPSMREDGTIREWIGTCIDITERRNLESAQQQHLSLIDATLEATADGILVVDLQRRVVRYNKKFVEMLEVPAALLAQGDHQQVLNHVVSKMADPKQFMRRICEFYANPQDTYNDRFELANGKIFERYSQPQWLGDKVVGRVTSFRDITERTHAEEKLVFLSFHDVLTGLYSRRYFEEELQRMDTTRQLPISIISGDVNGLKLTNDVFGHARGDELIITAARQLQSCCRVEDIVVRFGGDEFVVLLPKCDEARALEIIERIQAQCRDKTIEGIPVSLALGAATKTEPTEELNTVVNLAETRMYKNKSSEVNRIRLDTLEALERSVYEKDYKADHALRLQEFATDFGKFLWLPAEMISDLALLATLHDIGKIGIAEEILNKPDKPTEEEWTTIKTHPELGNRILRATRMVSFAVEEAVLLHHEHWDGSGYPKGLKAEAIPFISRAVAIIDAYDVMTHDRPYHCAITHEQAIAELQRCAGSQFDPVLVAKFVEFIGMDRE